MRFKPPNCKRLQGAADARRRVRRRTLVLQAPDNKADAVRCERLQPTGFRTQERLRPPVPSNPVFTVLQIVADFNLKINLFLSFTAILFNSYFKEKGLSRILILF